MKVNALVEQIAEIVKPIAEELNYDIYHIEYVKESGEYYLRIYIEKDGGVSLNDCEALSRRVSDVLDEKDPITDAYFLEVSSPGLNRGLYKEEHFKMFIGKEVLVKLTSSIDGTKSVKGILKDVLEDSIIIDAETEVKILKDKIKFANLEGEI